MRRLIWLIFPILLWASATDAADTLEGLRWPIPSTSAPALWQGSRTSGDGAMFQDSGQGITLQDAGQSSATFGQLTLNYPGFYSGGVPSAASNYLWLNQGTLTGTCTDSNTSPNACALATLSITDDQLNATNGRGPFLLYMNHRFGGGSSNGNFGGLYVQLTQAGNQTRANANLVAGLFKVFVNGNDGGSLGSESGAYFALNPDAEVGASGTNLTSIIGEEIDVAIQTGGSALDKIGLQIVSVGADAVQAGRESVGLSLNSQLAMGGTVPGWNYGILFGTYAGFPPVTSSGTLIGTICHVNNCGSFPMGTVAHGVDFSAYTFSSDAFKSTGFLVDGSGNTTVNALTGNSGNLAISAATNGAVTIGNATDGAGLRVLDSGGATVNIVSITPGQTGQSVTYNCGGPSSDTNVTCVFSAKGTGNLQFSTQSGTRQFQVNNTTSAADFVTVTGGAAGSPGVVTVGASGTDTDISISLAPKGAGVIKIGSTAGVTCSGSPTASFASTGGIVTHC